MIELEIKKNIGKFNLEIFAKTNSKILGILGQSGSGKTMILKCIAGLINPEKGYIKIKREYFDSSKSYNLKPEKRKIGYLFQSYGLFPNMTAEKNINFVCGDNKKTKELLEKVGLADKKDSYPEQLSGGQKQRLAMARMLSIEPELILLDEPFSALDQVLRREMEDYIFTLINSLEIPVILVSHNSEEVFRLCDDVLVINDGKVEDFGPKREVFLKPKTSYTAKLVGFDILLNKNDYKYFEFESCPLNKIVVKQKDIEIIDGNKFVVVNRVEEINGMTYFFKNKITGLTIKKSSNFFLNIGDEIGLKIKKFVNLK